MPKDGDVIPEAIKLHAERYAESVKQWGDEPYSNEDEPSFSWSACDFCGETLGGHRFAASVMQLHTEGN